MNNSWKYKIVTADQNNGAPAALQVEEILKKEGMSGWEAWHLQPLLNGDGKINNKFEIYFKQPL